MTANALDMLEKSTEIVKLCIAGRALERRRERRGMVLFRVKDRVSALVRKLVDASNVDA
jgi:hypothetical protein